MHIMKFLPRFVVVTAIIAIVTNHFGSFTEAFVTHGAHHRGVVATTITTTNTNNVVPQSMKTKALHAKSNNILESILSSFQTNTKSNDVVTAKYDNVIIEPDFRVAMLFLGIGFVLDTIPYIQLTLGPFITLLGILFLVQTLRIRFVFDETNNFELKTIQPFQSLKSDDISTLQDSGENVIVGGANRWDCNTIVNYDFFPRSLKDAPFFGQPILIYFKETQTPSETWNEGPGKIANDPDKVSNGTAIPGQVHFFPAICNAQQIEQEFMKRKCNKIL